MAQIPTVTHFFAGTGFFVSRNGQLITNAHVVENCVDIALRGDFGVVKADLVAADRKGDMALLRTGYRPMHIAQLHALPIRLQPGDRVQMLGYPNEYGQSGKPHITESVIESLYGPQNEPNWIQFRDSAQHGNSGGPLMDQAGLVVGMVTAKATLTRTVGDLPHGKSEETTDVAITLTVLEKFLDDAAVPYVDTDSQIYESDDRIKNLAQGFTVQVLCRQKE